jgi:hypothetical protein
MKRELVGQPIDWISSMRSRLLSVAVRACKEIKEKRAPGESKDNSL